MRASEIITKQRVNKFSHRKAKEMRHEMTFAEARLWRELRGNKFQGLHFRRQQVIQGYIVDFYCHALHLVIEVDGDIHANQQVEDAERENRLIAIGLQVIRFQNDEVISDIQAVLDRITLALKAPLPFREGAGG